VFHLHRFDDHHHVPLADLGARIDLDGNHAAGMG